MGNTNKQYKNEVESNALLGKLEIFLIGQDKKEAAVRLAAIRTNQDYDPKSVDILFDVLKTNQGDIGLPSSAFNENEKLSLNDFCAKNGIPHHFDINSEELDLNGIDFISFEVKKVKSVVKSDEDIVVVKNPYGEWVAKDSKTGKVIVPDDKPVKPSIKDTPVGKTSRVEKESVNKAKNKTVVEKTTHEKAKEEYEKGIKKFVRLEEFQMDMTLLANALGCLHASCVHLKYDMDVKRGSLYDLNNNKTAILNKIRRNRTIGDYFKLNGITFENVKLQVFVITDQLRFMFMTVKDYMIILDGNHNNEDGAMNILWAGPIHQQTLINNFVKYISVYRANGNDIPGNTNWKAMKS